MNSRLKTRVSKLENTRKRVEFDSREIVFFASEYRITSEHIKMVAGNLKCGFESIVKLRNRPYIDNGLVKYNPIPEHELTDNAHKITHLANLPIQFYYEGLLREILKRPHKIDFNLAELGLENFESIVQSTPHIDYTFAKGTKVIDSSQVTSDQRKCLEALAELMVSQFIEKQKPVEYSDDNEQYEEVS